VAARLPLDAMLIETDAPWLAPAPDRGKRNEPAFVVRTADTLAQIHNVARQELASITTRSFLRLFGLPPAMGN
jgi:TatD DNase family protein